MVQGGDYNDQANSFVNKKLDFASTEALNEETCVVLGERPPCEG